MEVFLRLSASYSCCPQRLLLSPSVRDLHCFGEGMALRIGGGSAQGLLGPFRVGGCHTEVLCAIS